MTAVKTTAPHVPNAGTMVLAGSQFPVVGLQMPLAQALFC
jgi:hypothetical protein